MRSEPETAFERYASKFLRTDTISHLTTKISTLELPIHIRMGRSRHNGDQISFTAGCAAALRLGHWFGTSPEFWLNLQKLYELRLAREQVGNRVERLPKLKERKRAKARRAA
jgi:hypothetical protein